MASKQALLGICDLCGGEIPPHLGPYTSKGKPRLYCGDDCKNTANSRAGAPERSRKAKRRVARGEWQNPADLHKPDPANIAAGVSQARKAEVQAGTWRNPALDDVAREMLSRPRQHGDNPALHSAIEKFKRGLKIDQFAPEEQLAYRAYRRRQRRELWERTPEAEREELRRQWRERWRRRKKQNPRD